MKSYIDTRFKTSIIAGAVIAILLSVADLSQAWHLLRQNNYDFLSILCAPGKPSLPITIVTIDEPSFNQLGLQWPWPRNIHAQLITELSRAGAAVIGVDILFAEESDNINDNELADSIKQAGNVVLASDIQRFEIGSTRSTRVIEPIEKLITAGAVVGLTTIPLDRDRSVRHLPTSTNSFWLEILKMYEKYTNLHMDISAPISGSLINFTGPTDTIERVPYYQVLDRVETLPKDKFKGRIVLVGLDIGTSPDLSARGDRFSTPFFILNNSLMSGVEIHANIIDTIMSKRVITPSTLIETLVGNTLFLFIASMCMFNWRLIRGAIISLCVITGTIIFSIWLFYYQHRFYPFSDAMIGIVIVYLGFGTKAYLRERRIRHGIQNAFGQYVSHEVARQLIQDPESIHLGGARRRITLMFADLAGFTDLSERLDAEIIVMILNEYTSQMGEIIRSNNGTIDKYMGDGIMAFWGAPLSDPKQESNACHAAVEMLSKMKDLSTTFTMKGWPPLKLRIGIHTGDAIVGNIGGKQHIDYTVVGDNVNLASRLESVNKLYETELIISESTAYSLDPSIGLRWLDRIRVKGKSQSVEIYTICDDTFLIDITEEAIRAHRDRNWDLSEQKWKIILENYGNDHLSRMYLAKIEEYRITSPSRDWDGATTLSLK